MICKDTKKTLLVLKVSTFFSTISHQRQAHISVIMIMITAGRRYAIRNN